MCLLKVIACVSSSSDTCCFRRTHSAVPRHQLKYPADPDSKRLYLYLFPFEKPAANRSNIYVTRTIRDRDTGVRLKTFTRSVYTSCALREMITRGQVSSRPRTRCQVSSRGSRRDTHLPVLAFSQPHARQHLTKPLPQNTTSTNAGPKLNSSRADMSSGCRITLHYTPCMLRYRPRYRTLPALQTLCLPR